MLCHQPHTTCAGTDIITKTASQPGPPTADATVTAADDPQPATEASPQTAALVEQDERGNRATSPGPFATASGHFAAASRQLAAASGRFAAASGQLTAAPRSCAGFDNE